MRDSFFTGVSEGVINTERILEMLTVSGDSLAVESKGIYSIEKFIVARRLMYWQVYYHKTVLAAEYMLVSILGRAKYLSDIGTAVSASASLSYFLNNRIERMQFENDPVTLDTFARLDDVDVLSAIKDWSDHPDAILSSTSKALINRNLFRVIISENPFEEQFINRVLTNILHGMKIQENELEFLVTMGKISNNVYDPLSHKINIVDKNGGIRDFSEISDQLNIGIYSRVDMKYFICFPKWAE
jgi:HD superfamily phosphohydrolase